MKKAEGLPSLKHKSDCCLVSIPQNVVRRRIEGKFTPVHEDPAIKRRAQQSQHKERSSCDF